MTRTSPPARQLSPARLVALAGLGSLLPLLSMGCSGVDDRPYAWDYISPAIFQPTCATPSCHSRAVAVAGLDFSDPDRGYRSLTALSVLIANPQSIPDGGCESIAGTTYCRNPRPLVIPYDPAQSRLVNMLRARGAPRMPPDRPLTELDIELVERWILDGARRTPSGPIAGSPTDGGDAGGDGGALPNDGGLQ